MSSKEATLRRGYTSCRFGQLHYLEGRPAHGSDEVAPTLVMLHQNPSSSVEYEPLLERLARDRRVVAFDTPGYGMSDPPPGPLSMAEYASAFCDGVEALELSRSGPVDAFGYHTGALLAAELGLQRPEAVARLVLSGIPLFDSETRAGRLAAARTGPKPTEDGAELLAQSAALWRRVVSERHRDMPLERAVTLYAEKNKPLHRGWWAYEGVWTYSVETRFPLITQPTLCLQPHEPLLEPSRQACSLIPGAVLRELAELDRDIFDVGGDLLAREMRAFLSPGREKAAPTSRMES